MIYCLTGKIIKKTLNAVVLSCGGVGYYAQCPASVAGALPGVGKEATLYTVMSVTENDISLYGFALWRWTGYNMVFYLAGLQNIDYSIYEAARIDGASPLQQFVHLTIPLLKPTILLTAIMSTSGTLQLFDESVNLTAGGPGKATMTLTHYIYNISFVETPKFNYAAALSVFILSTIPPFEHPKKGKESGKRDSNSRP